MMLLQSFLSFTNWTSVPHYLSLGYVAIWCTNLCRRIKRKKKQESCIPGACRASCASLEENYLRVNFTFCRSSHGVCTTGKSQLHHIYILLSGSPDIRVPLQGWGILGFTRWTSSSTVPLQRHYSKISFLALRAFLFSCSIWHGVYEENVPFGLH